MAPPQKHIVFDVVGTLVSFSAFYSRINDVLGPKLCQYTINPSHFGYTWMTAAELEFTFLSISSRHTPYSQVMRSIFYRSLYMAGVSDPRAFATETERDECIAAYSELELRPGAKECIQQLRDAGFNVWVLTTADISRVRGYFDKGGVDMPASQFVSCDTAGVAKPALAAYKPVFERFGPDDQKWFAAAHMWDVSAARKVGFKGAYCSLYEKESCADIFGGEMDVMSSGLVELAAKVIEASLWRTETAQEQGFNA